MICIGKTKCTSEKGLLNSILMQTFSFVLAKKHAHSSREWKHLFWLKKHAHSSREWKHPIHHQYLLLDTLLDTLLDKSSTLANNKLLLLRMLAVLMLALRVKTRLRKPSLRWRTNARNVSSCFLDFLYLNWNYQRLSWWTGNSRLSESFTSAAPQFLSKLLLLLYYSLSWITYSNRKWRTYVLGYNLCFFSLELWSLKKKKKVFITAADRDFNRRKLCIFAQQNNQSYEHYIHFI